MAFCDQRGLELQAGLARNLHPHMAESDRTLLLAAVTEWDARRREHLDALCKILLEPSGTETAKLWRARIESLREALRKFSDTVRNVARPLEGPRQFLQVNAAADDKFLTALAATVAAAEARDYMVEYLAVLRNETRNLETKWQALLAQHGSYHAQELAVIEQVEAMVRQAAVNARELDGKMASTIASTVSTTKSGLQGLPEGAPDAGQIPMNNELVIAGLTVDLFRTLKVGIEDQTSRFERYMREETGSVLFVFQDVREDTQQFIDKFGYRTVIEKEQAAFRALDAFVANGATSSGNRHDAEKFAEAARILVKGHANSARNTWDDFVTKHEKKFFGPVGPDFTKALLDRDQFENKYRNLQADNLHELASRWRNNARELWGVSFSGLPPYLAETYANALKSKLRELDELLRDPLLRRFGDGMKVVMENGLSMIRK